MAGRDDQDPGSAGKSFYYTPEYARPIRDLKIGYHPADFEQWPEPAMRPAYKTALNVIRTLGADVVELQTPDMPYGPIIGAIIESEAASAFESFILYWPGGSIIRSHAGQRAKGRAQLQRSRLPESHATPRADSAVIPSDLHDR